MLRFLRNGNKRTKTIWWVLIIITVVTFLGGFVFLFGAGFDSTRRARASGAIGTVNGEPITRDDYQAALVDQREQFHRQYGAEPAERDAKLVETQAWRGLVAQRLLGAEAKALHLVPHDREVILALETSPPSQVASNPAFQTDGKFDPTKYQQAMKDPSNNWSSFEDLIRKQLPVRKLQERLLSSIKLSEPELRDAFRDQYEAVSGVALQLTPDPAEKVPAPTPADLDRIYQQYKGRFYAGPRVELEVLREPKKFSPEDQRAARQLAQGLVDRAQHGEDFSALAKDYSEGPGADQGGVIERPIQTTELGPQLATQLMALPIGGVAGPFEENGSVLVLKLLERVQSPTSPMPALRLAQIVLKVHANENTLRDQLESLNKIRTRAGQIKSLGKAAVEKGKATARTGFFDLNSNPPVLAAVPEAMDWGLTAKAGAISPVFEGSDEFVIAQVSSKVEGGTRSRDELAETLRQVAELDARVTRLKPRADQLQAALAQGQTLEQAAKAVNATTIPFTHMTRSQPDPRLAQTLTALGAIFATPAGKTTGPVREVNGWYFGRVDARIAPAPAMFDSVKGQLSTEILRRRQQTFFSNWLAQMQAKATIQDLRSEALTR